jgi:hypothetical protein
VLVHLVLLLLLVTVPGATATATAAAGAATGVGGGDVPGDILAAIPLKLCFKVEDEDHTVREASCSLSAHHPAKQIGGAIIAVLALKHQGLHLLLPHFPQHMYSSVELQPCSPHVMLLDTKR